MTYPSFFSEKKDTASKFYIFLTQTVDYAHARYLKESLNSEKEHTVYSWLFLVHETHAKMK